MAIPMRTAMTLSQRKHPSFSHQILQILQILQIFQLAQRSIKLRPVQNAKDFGITPAWMDKSAALAIAGEAAKTGLAEFARAK